MRKILIGVIILLLLVLGYFMCFKSITIGSFKIASIDNIKNMSYQLDAKLEEANKISAQTYPKEKNNLEDAEKKLNTTKTEYDSKMVYATANQEIFSTYERNYKIETLMVDLGRHSKQNKLKDLRLDLKTSYGTNLYDLNLTIVGSYESIYNFIYSIENDDDLLFEIVNLNVQPYMIKTTTTITYPAGGSDKETDYPYDQKETITSENIGGTTSTTNTNPLGGMQNNQNTTSTNSGSKEDVVYDPKNVQAEFTIKNVIISFE